jgi:hypothetical protein
MNDNDNNIEKKGNGAIIGVTGAVLGLVTYAAMKALADKETREKIVDTFFEVKKKLSETNKNAKIEHLNEKN